MKKTYFSVIVLAMVLLFCACSGKADSSENKHTDALELKYAGQFSVDYPQEGYKHIRIADGTDYICVPEGGQVKDFGYRDAVIIRLPVSEIYLAASSAMDLFVQLDALDMIGSCSTKASDYSIKEAAERIENGDIRYVGKYSAPDYETIINSGCSLAIESTMITHSPEIKEELERLGLPVLVERSSYENDPLGRLEWIKLYGVLLDREEEARIFFDAEEEKFISVRKKLETEDNGERPTVAFFHISSNGYVNIRKPGDYISSMIELAGGTYCPGNIEIENPNALSTMNIDWEQFYAQASQADILIYNTAIDGGLETVDDLIAKNKLFAGFKAVKSGSVYCTDTDVFQKSSAVCDVIEDLYAVINDGAAEDLKYIYKLR